MYSSKNSNSSYSNYSKPKSSKTTYTNSYAFNNSVPIPDYSTFFPSVNTSNFETKKEEFSDHEMANEIFGDNTSSGNESINNNILPPINGNFLFTPIQSTNNLFEANMKDTTNSLSGDKRANDDNDIARSRSRSRGRETKRDKSVPPARSKSKKKQIKENKFFQSYQEQLTKIEDKLDNVEQYIEDSKNDIAGLEQIVTHDIYRRLQTWILKNSNEFTKTTDIWITYLKYELYAWVYKTMKRFEMIFDQEVIPLLDEDLQEHAEVVVVYVENYRKDHQIQIQLADEKKQDKLEIKILDALEMRDTNVNDCLADPNKINDKIFSYNEYQWIKTYISSYPDQVQGQSNEYKQQLIKGIYDNIVILLNMYTDQFGNPYDEFLGDKYAEIAKDTIEVWQTFQNK